MDDSWILTEDSESASKMDPREELFNEGYFWATFYFKRSIYANEFSNCSQTYVARVVIYLCIELQVDMYLYMCMYLCMYVYLRMCMYVSILVRWSRDSYGKL